MSGVTCVLTGPLGQLHIGRRWRLRFPAGLRVRSRRIRRRTSRRDGLATFLANPVGHQSGDQSVGHADDCETKRN